MPLRRGSWDREGVFSGEKAERAIIDIGSNTVRLVIYGGSSRAPTVLFNEKVVARLGRDIAATGRLADDAMELALRGLRRFALLLEDLGIQDVETVATAAVREAENGPDFLLMVEEAGLHPRVLSGEQEARISALGVIGAFPRAQGIVADLGGGSLELTPVAGAAPGRGISLPLGTLRLADLHGGDQADLRKAVAKIIKKAGWAEPIDGALYLVGGTWRSMAVYAMQQRGYPLSDPHGFALTSKEAAKLAAAIAASTPEELRKTPRISAMRSATLPDAAALLQVLLEKLEPQQVVFSSWGLREGLLFDRLVSYAQGRDPLLAAMALFAAQRGAPPLLAARVAGWTVDAIPAVRSGTERVRLAATMLALATMQVEPNLRIHQAMDWALHKRWIDLDPEGRAMLAAACAANGNQCDLPDELHALAREERLEEAICWGLAIRLCRRLGARSRRSLQSSSLAIEGDALVLKLEETHAGLFGVPNEKDLNLLAARMGLAPQLIVVPEDSLVRSIELPLEITPPAL
jgi:exopolyphosphatase/guanosine-5'-triphosphate,3'-diphosphate pyrophosphatase